MSILTKAHEELKALLEVENCAREVAKSRWLGIASQEEQDERIRRLDMALGELDDTRASELPTVGEETNR